MKHKVTQTTQTGNVAMANVLVGDMINEYDVCTDMGIPTAERI